MQHKPQPATSFFRRHNQSCRNQIPPKISTCNKVNTNKVLQEHQIVTKDLFEFGNSKYFMLIPLEQADHTKAIVTNSTHRLKSRLIRNMSTRRLQPNSQHKKSNKSQDLIRTTKKPKLLQPFPKGSKQNFNIRYVGESQKILSNKQNVLKKESTSLTQHQTIDIKLKELDGRAQTQNTRRLLQKVVSSRRSHNQKSLVEASVRSNSKNSRSKQKVQTPKKLKTQNKPSAQEKSNQNTICKETEKVVDVKKSIFSQKPLLQPVDQPKDTLPISSNQLDNTGEIIQQHVQNIEPALNTQQPSNHQPVLNIPELPKQIIPDQSTQHIPDLPTQQHVTQQTVQMYKDPYEDLLLSEDKLAMSSINSFIDEGSYHSENTSYEQLPIQPTNKSISTQKIKGSVMQLHQQTPQLSQQNKKIQIIQKKCQQFEKRLDEFENSVQQFNRTESLHQSTLTEQAVQVNQQFPPPVKQSIFSPNHQLISEDNVCWYHYQQVPNYRTASVFSSNLPAKIQSNKKNHKLVTILNILFNYDCNLLKKLFQNDVVSLYHNHQYHQFTMDSCFPFLQHTLQPYSCYSTNGDTWVFAVQKALAILLNGYQQVWNRNYDQLVTFLVGPTPAVLIDDKMERYYKIVARAIDNGDLLLLLDQNQQSSPRIITNYKMVNNKPYVCLQNHPYQQFESLMGQYHKMLIVKQNLKHLYNTRQPIDQNTVLNFTGTIDKTTNMVIHTSIPEQSKLTVSIYRAEDTDNLLLIASATHTKQIVLETYLKKADYHFFFSISKESPANQIAITFVSNLKFSPVLSDPLIRLKDDTIGNDNLHFQTVKHTTKRKPKEQIYKQFEDKVRQKRFITATRDE